LYGSFDEYTIKLNNYNLHGLNNMQSQKTIFGILVTVIASIMMMMVYTIASTVTLATAQQATTSMKSTVVRDSATILLQDKTIPAKGFIHLYDATPYMIWVGHIAANLPCDANSVSPYKILIGQAPNLTAAEFENVKELSTPGKMCLYHVDVASKPGKTITDIAIQNPTDQEIKFPPMSSIVIGVDEIMPGAEKGGAMGNMTMGS
jgi:hypothetical protein